MTTWTKELPKVDGYYWYRNPGCEAIVTRWCALEFELFDGAQADSVGEWWPIRILPPDEAQQTWRESDQTFADMKAYLETLPKGLITIHDPALPQPVPVKIDPSQPHA